MEQTELILVTGATGYIGGRLVPRLLDAGYRVRCLVRDAERLKGRPWSDRVDVVEGDALRPETLAPAMEGVAAAYYLIHSLTDTAEFHERDMMVARDFGLAAKSNGVQRIIYLGGLGDPDSDLSEHLRSRQQTGDALREAGVPVTEFRAAVIVGSGSLSFEMIRYLTERLPIMITHARFAAAGTGPTNGTGFVVVLIVVGVAAFLFVGYLVFDALRTGRNLRKLALKRRKAQEAWEQEGKEEP